MSDTTSAISVERAAPSPVPLAPESAVVDAFRAEAEARRELDAIHRAVCWPCKRGHACSTGSDLRRQAEDAAIRLCRAEDRERERQAAAPPHAPATGAGGAAVGEGAL